MSALALLKKLYHGGRKFTEWNPNTIGSGERGILAQGPGLYAGDNPKLAKIYMKYGGDQPTLSELLVDDTMIFNPSKKMTEPQLEAYNKAAAQLDKLGLKASNYGIRNALLNRNWWNPQEVRQLLSESGVAGFRQSLGEGFGDEFSIFDPQVIKSIRAVDPTKFRRGGLVQYKERKDAQSL